MKGNLKLFIGLACMSLGLTACEEDYFDQEAYDELVIKAFPVQDVDPTQDWALLGTATLDVAVNKVGNEQYRLAVYKENPNAVSSLTVLSQGIIKDDETLQVKLSYELASPIAYVALYNSQNQRMVKQVALTNGGTTPVDFFAERVGAQSRMTRSQTNPLCPDISQPYDEAWVTNYLKTAKEPNSNNISHNYDNSTPAEASKWVKTGEHWVEGKPSEWVVTKKAVITKEPVLPNFGWADDPVGMIMYNWGNPSQADRDFYNDELKSYINRYNNVTLEYDQTNKPKEYVDTRNEKIDRFLDMYNLLRDNNRLSWINVWASPEKGEYTPEEGYWTEATEGHMVEDGYWTEAKPAYVDEDFVLNFKITGTYNGTIGVAATEGYDSYYDQETNTTVYTDKKDPYCARTIVVTGTWNIDNDQRIGSGGLIVIANGGTVNVASGKKLETVNQARIVVLPGGKLTGAGYVEVSNGNGVGGENYNGGTIDVAKFNNNFGKFYNYGKFLVSEYLGGAKESNFYNHALVHIQYTGLNNETPNARIFNACQWYCENNMRCRNYEGIGGSSFIVGGQLMVSGSEDGTTTPSYFALAAGALVKAGSLYNNGTSWTGPTSGGFAVVSVGQIDFLNWAQDTQPLDYGYFENNIYVDIKDDTNIPGGNGYQSGETATAAWKFWNIVANGLGGGTTPRGTENVIKVQESDKASDMLIPASDGGFELGVKGCTPGYDGTPFTTPKEDETTTALGYRYCFEDNFPTPGDYDFNDCVVTLTPHVTAGSNTVTVDVSLDATGATKKIAVGLRIKGLKYSMLNGNMYACSSTTDFDANVPAGTAGSKIPAKSYNNLYIVDEGDLYNKGGEKIDDVTLRICDDLHWSLGKEKQGDYTRRWFFNTVAEGVYSGDQDKVVAPAKATWTFSLAAPEYAQYFNYENFDVFIVEQSGIDFEVHTFDDKYTQVMKWGEPNKLNAYKGATAIYTWAICVPHSEKEPYLYPVEWQSISGNTLTNWSGENNAQTSTAAYPDFYKWVQDKTKNLDWYKNYTPGLVYNRTPAQ